MEDKLIADIKDRMKCQSDEISGQIKSLCLTVDECVEIGRTIDEKMKSVYHEMREIVAQIQQNTAEIKNLVEPTLQAAEKNMQHARKAINESIEAHEIEVNGHRERFIEPKIPEDFKVKQSELKNIAQQKAVQANDTLKEIAVKNAASIACSREHFETLLADITPKRDIIDSDGRVQALKTELNSNHKRVSEQDKENIAAINDFVMKSNQMTMINADEISSCVKQLKYFRELDFCEYEPSGE